MGKKFDWAVVSSVALAWIYFLGAIFQSSFFAALGLGGHDFQLAFEQVLVSGVTFLTVSLPRWLSPILISIEILVVVIVLFGAIYALRLLHRLYMAARDKRGHDPRTEIAGHHPGIEGHSADDGPRKWVVPGAVLAACFLLIMFSAVGAQMQGKREAHNVVAKAKTFDAASHIVSFTNGRIAHLGPTIGCDQLVCVFMASDRAVLVSRAQIAAETGVASN